MMWFWILCVATAAVYSAEGAGAGAARLVCYVENARASNFTECTHLVYTGDARGDKLDTLLKDYRKNNPKLKIVLRVSETDKDLRSLLKPKHVQGLEIHDAHRSLNKTKVSDLVDSAKAALASSGGGPLFLALPAHPELLAKYYDLRNVVKKADLMMVQTHALGLVKKMTFHPSRLSGLWDMMNTDSVVDLVIGLGVPASKLVISLPATARQFRLQNETLSTPGSPTEDDEPKEIDQAELCRQLRNGRWTLERDQDLSAPYAFKDKTWISFEDASSVDVKGKYARVRGLAGLALQGADRDADTPCGPTLKASLAKVLNQQSRAPRAAVLRSLEHEILSAPSNALEALQVSPYRITQIVDSDGVIHSIREDTRTEFSCSRQGYFVHPRSCARFYRCVKFDQLSPDFTVFEFDCPAGLAFDSRYEVCVWPGSLAHSQACPGSSEIAPVPRSRFQCPQYEGYYADPENCRWFFACLDHGTVPLTAYEFRCPFGLGFDAERLKCDWPWLVPACGNIGRYEAEAHGFSAATLTGAAGFRGQTAESVNIAAHQSLVSGASLNNLVGIQGHFLTDADTLDANFISSQEYSPEASGQIYRTETTAPGFSTSGISVESDSSNGNSGLVQATSYNDNAGGEHYSSGSLILDDYRLPAASSASSNRVSFNSGKYQGNTATSAAYSRTTSGRKYQTGQYVKDNSGRYVHNSAGDRAKPYQHVDSVIKPYLHDADKYKYTGTYDAGKYSGSGSSTTQSLSGGYNYPNPSTPFEDGIAYAGESENRYQSQGYTDGSSGAYVDVSSSNAGYQSGYSSSTSHGNTGSLYRLEGQVGGYTDGEVTGNAEINVQQYNSYNNADVGNYVTDSRAYTGASHTLTAGAINVGLVGKTSLVDVEEINQGNYQTGHEVVHENGQGGQVNYVSQPAVSISHVGTDSQNLDGYTFVTNPTSSGIPTTATPFAVTTSLPAVTNTYRTTYVPLAPKTSVKQVFGYTQPAVTYVQPTVVDVKQQYVTPRIEITDHSQGSDYQYQSRDYTASNTYNTGSTKESQSSGYYYSEPSTRFDEGISVSSPAPAVSVTTFKPRGFSHNQQTEHRVESGGYEYQAPVTEVPFRKAVAYTTGPSVSTYVQPTESTYTPHSYSHQTLHKVESSNFYAPSVEVTGHEAGITYQEPQTVVQYTTARPAVVQPVVTYSSSTPQPEVYSHQTLHKVDTSKVTQYSQGELATGYEYNQPQIQLHEESNSGYQYSTPAPVVSSTYSTPSYSHQTIHKTETQRFVPTSVTRNEYTYQTTPVTVYENPILKYTQNVTPVSYVSPAQSYSQQTIHQTSQTADIGSSGYEYTKPRVTVQESYVRPEVIQYSTPQPAISVQPAVSTYVPQTYSQQTIHKVDASQVNTYSQGGENGYEYSQPAVKYQEASVIETSSPAPAVSYTPQTFSHQTLHKINRQKFVPVSTTAIPSVGVAYQQPEVTVYQNPILQYTQNVTPAPVSVFTQTYKPLRTKITRPIQYPTTTQQSYIQVNQDTYNQPEIQRDIETSNAATYSDASAVSHQVFHQTHDRSQSDAGKNVIFVSTSPSTLVYESHYTDYGSPRTVETYKVPEYIPPKTEYQQTYSVSTISPPVVYQQSSDTHETLGYNYNTQRAIPEKVESIHFSSAPRKTVTTTFNQLAYSTPEIQQGYKAEEYLPPVSSTLRPVTTTYRPRYLTTTTREYLPPTSEPKYNAPEYLPPSENTYLPPVENTYLPPASPSESLPFARKNTYLPPPSPTPESREYLPPVEKSSPSTVNFESFGYDNNGVSFDTKLGYNPYQDNGRTYFAESSSTAAPQRKQNIVVETAKSNLLGFGTVGPDAGLVSPVSYTTSAPIVVSSTGNSYIQSKYVTSTYAPEIVEVTSPASRRSKPKYRRPLAKSTTQEPVYFQSSTTYKAPEYLPPSEETDELVYKKYQVFNSDDSFVSSTAAPYQRKQNIVVETAKSHSLGFGTVGPDAGLVSPVTYTTSAPSESYSLSYAPVKQGLVEVTGSRSSSRRNKPKVAVVTKINDFNPLLVRKLGAVCSCQSPVLVLKGRRPSAQQESIDYNNNYEDSGRGDIGDDSWLRKSTKYSDVSTVVTANPTTVTSTFNPIIVPDDSFYQDYQEASNSNDNVEILSNGETYVSSTPAVSTTQKSVRIRPRVKTVTAAPSYKTVLLNQEVTPTAIVDDAPASVSVASHSFDRYGPGGWRSRDETLQGSVDCKRAGLFRHPKQCNKFYACRWDCTKQRFTLHVFNCPVQLSFDPNLGACNWPSQGPACQGDTLLTNTL